MQIKKILLNPVIINISWLLFEKLFTVALIFWSEGLIARSLTTYNYGQWIYALNLVTLLSSAALIAGAEVSVPALSRNKLLKNEIITSVFIIRILFACMACIAVIIYASYFVYDPILKKLLYVFSLMLIFNEPFSIVINYYQSIVKIKKIVFYRIVSLLCRCIIVYICYKYWDSILLLSFSRVAEFLVLSLFLVALAKHNKFKWIINKGVVKKIFYRGVYFWPSLMLMYFYLKVDRFYVQHYLSFSWLAIYGVAVQLMEQLFVLIKMILQSASPIYIYRKLERRDLKKNLFTLTLIILSVSAVLSLVAIYLIPWMIQHIFGAKYLVAASLSVKMLPALFFFSIDSVLMQYIYREKLGKAMLVKWGGGVIIMSISYYIYFSLFKMTDLAFIYNINYFIMAVLTFVIFIRDFYYVKKS